MSSITILHHLGLGDQIMLNGMVRHFAENENVNIFVKQNHEKSVEFMYKDIRDRVNIIPLDNVNPSYIRSKIPEGSIVLPLATYGMNDATWNVYTSATNWAHGVYLQAKVNPLYMYTKFKVIRNNSIQITPPSKDYIFVHDDNERNTCINVKTDMFVYKPDSKLVSTHFYQCDDYNIFDYIHLIENANEVHCMNSSYAWLIEMMKLGNKKTNFFHLNISHLYYKPDIVKTVFSDHVWSFVD
jgi:hypothetical protein